MSSEPASDDPLIAELGDAEWLAWMHENFFVEKDVPELGDAKSYAVRLSTTPAPAATRLRGSSNACAPTRRAVGGGDDVSAAHRYVLHPVRQPARLLDPLGDALELVVYAHSLDFGKKAYGNLVELARLQEHVAGELARPVGRLVVHAKSAHVYEPEWALMAELGRLPGTA